MEQRKNGTLQEVRAADHSGVQAIMKTVSTTLAEVGMIVGMGIALFGGLAILAVSKLELVVGFVSWGMGSAFIIFTAGRTAIGNLKRDLKNTQTGSH
jgi:hypothetical protein